MLEPCVHAPLPFESITFLTFTRLPLPLRLSDSVAHSGICLTFAAWMIHGPLGFCSLHPISFFDWALLRCGLSLFHLAHIPFYPTSIGWLTLLPCITLLLLRCHLSFCVLVTSGLTSWSICHVNFLYHFFFRALLANIPVGPAHSVPWAFSAHFIPCASLAHFILPYLFHSHGFLLNLLGFPGPITTSLPFRLIGLCVNPMNLLIPFLSFPSPFLLSLHLLQFLWAYYFIP